MDSAAPDTTTPSTSALVQKLGVGDLAQPIGALGLFQQTMLNFVNYITTIGVPPPLVANPEVPASVTDAANAAIANTGTDFKAAQATASGLQTQISGITDVLSATSTFARHGQITMKAILDAIVAYKSNNQSVDRPALKSQIQTMVSNCTELETKTAGAHTDTGDAVVALQAHESKLNSDFAALQQAIPAGNGPTLDLDHITEQQAFSELQAHVEDLNKQITAVKQDIVNLTIGQVTLGTFGGWIAIIGCWNPIGWIVAGGVAGGEVAIANAKAADAVRLNTDLENVALSTAEEEILKPLYSIKNAVSELGTGVTSVEGVGTVLESLKDGLEDSLEDLDTFLADVTGNVSLDELKSDAKYIMGDYKNLQTLCDNLITPMASHVVPLSAIANAQPASS